MAINRASIAKELLPGLNAVFGIEYGEVNEEHKPLYEIESSDRAFEEEVLFTGFGAGIHNGNWTAGAGSTRTGNSGYELDASAPVYTNLGGMRVIRRAPWDTATSSSAGETDNFPWFEVRINNHVDNFTTATVSTA